MFGGFREHVRELLSSFPAVGPPAVVIRSVFICWQQRLTADLDSSSSVAFEVLKWSPRLKM